MAKLIYLGQTKANAIGDQSLIKDGSYAWNNSNNKYYNSLVFTSDGHLLTHGIDYSLGSSNNLYKLTLNGQTNGNNVNGANDLGSFYAPTSAGTQNQILQANASGIPTWKSLIAIGDSDSYEIPTLNKVEALISTSSTSFLQWKGNTSSVPSNANATKVGYAWRASGTFTIPANNSVTGSAETVEVGDILICTTAYSGSNTPKFTVAQTNWTGSTGDSTLSWNTEVTLATIGGIAIKAKLPVNPNTNTTYSFFVGESGATSYANNITNPYLTVKSSSSDTAANILQLYAGTGIEIKTDGTTDGKINIKNTGVISFNNKTGDLTSSYDSSTNKLTIAGTAYTLNNTNTWRNVKINKVGQTASTTADSTLEELKGTSIGTGALEFGSAFGWVDADNERKVELAWEEIYLDGSTTKYKYYV